MDSSSTLNSTATDTLALKWAFGFNKDVLGGVHSLCSEGRNAIFFVAAHTGVIYDYAKRTQELLQACGTDEGTQCVGYTIAIACHRFALGKLDEGSYMVIFLSRHPLFWRSFVADADAGALPSNHSCGRE